MEKVCIVVPVYKKELNLFEKISLRQLVRTLGKYPIYLVQPKTIEINYEELSDCKYNVCKFDEWYFQNTGTYSELMLSPFFYEHFLTYKYMLVYQLDCFVFFDGLSEFCDMDYDYVGAPQYHGWSDDIVVGNGGLSLRKTDAVLNVTKKYNEIVQEPYFRDFFRKWEDNFFSYCGRKRELGFLVPDISLANTFSTVMDVEDGIQNIPVKGLPFGTHAWHRMNFDFWRDIIKVYGYQTDGLIANKNVDTLKSDQNIRCRDYFFSEISSLPFDIKNEIVEMLGLDRNKKYVMWGAGEFGKKCLAVLLDLEVNVLEIIDSRPKVEQISGISVKYPDYENIRKHEFTVLIGSQLYESEIEQELIKNRCEDLIKLATVFNEKWEILQKKYLGLLPEVEGTTKPFYFIENKSWISNIVRYV